jgi:chorismate mutase
MRLVRVFAAAACAVLLAGSPLGAAEASSGAFTRGDVARVDRLLVLIQERLEHAPRLAETRWREGGRIEDHASEERLLDAARKDAAALKLDPELATRFAQAQVDAAKIIQTERHKHWSARPGDAPQRKAVADPLRASTVEPDIPRALLAAYRDAIVILKRQGARSLLDARAADLIRTGGGDLLAAQAALKPLYELAR